MNMMSDVNNVRNEDFPLNSWSQSEVKHRFALKIERFQEKYNATMASTNQCIC